MIGAVFLVVLVLLTGFFLGPAFIEAFDIVLEEWKRILK